MGIQGLSIFDDEPVEIADLSANVCSKYSFFFCNCINNIGQFFLEERDVGTKRAEACLKKLTELNERVRTVLLPALTPENLLHHKVF